MGLRAAKLYFSNQMGRSSEILQFFYMNTMSLPWTIRFMGVRFIKVMSSF